MSFLSAIAHGWYGTFRSGVSRTMLGPATVLNRSAPCSSMSCDVYARFQEPWMFATPSAVRGGVKVFIFSTAQAWNLAGSASGHPAAVRGICGWARVTVPDTTTSSEQAARRPRNCVMRAPLSTCCRSCSRSEMVSAPRPPCNCSHARTDRSVAETNRRRHRSRVRDGHGFWAVNPSHETLGCQFTNVPLGFSFQAQTCSV